VGKKRKKKQQSNDNVYYDSRINSTYRFLDVSSPRVWQQQPAIGVIRARSVGFTINIYIYIYINTVAQSSDNVFTSYIITQRERHSKQYAHTHTTYRLIYIELYVYIYIYYRKIFPHSWARVSIPIYGNLSPK
jgi:hypothetical protein